jgi:hypothetical protein
MTPDLVIEYGLDGGQPGYRFRPPVRGFSEEALRVIWRCAMPRGQGWGGNSYVGARSLKCFPVDAHTAALSLVTVTDQQDEVGRRGIRRAEITLVPARDHLAYLERRLEAYPASVRAAAQHRLPPYLWRRILDKAVPKLKRGQPVVLAHPYTGPQSWQFIEALMLRLVTSRAVRLIEGWGAVSSFTTLALDWHDESRLVALPLDRARELRGVTVIVVP